MNKEKNARERAIEFAKSIPKPKVKQGENNPMMMYRGGSGGDHMMSNGIIEEHNEEGYDEYGNTLKGYSELNDRHEMLGNEVDQIKRMFN